VTVMFIHKVANELRRFVPHPLSTWWKKHRDLQSSSRTKEGRTHQVGLCIWILKCTV